MKTVTVELSDEQAARIETIAALVNMTPGQLLTCLSFAEFAGWEGSPQEWIYGVNEDFKNYVQHSKVTGEDIEALLRGGLAQMSFSKLIKLTAELVDEEKTEAGVRLHWFEAAGRRMLSA
jgi:hypothetical protein